ncbi:MAG TPA: periplasmic heavy metal sensor [Candidatus Omnitrophota bacterium]|nr:periplasmic heavy metal sensor [Candidatus Omnitrophota bacterium]
MFDNKFAAVLVIAIVIIGASSLAFAFGPEPGGPGGPGGPGDPGRPPARDPQKFVERIAKDLGLTKEQQDKLLADAKKTEEETDQLRAKNKDLFDKVEKELLKDSPDRDLLHGYLQQIGQNETQMQIKRMDRMVDLRKTLTPEQKAKFEKMAAENRQKGPKMFYQAGHHALKAHGEITAEAK